MVNGQWSMVNGQWSMQLINCGRYKVLDLRETVRQLADELALIRLRQDYGGQVGNRQ
jgi:hypothetical protein